MEFARSDDAPGFRSEEPGREVHVWRFVLDQPPHVIRHLEATLAPEETLRADRFVRARDRSRFVAGRGAVRTILARYLRKEAGRLEIGRGRFGKPLLAGPDRGSGLRFNLTHSRGCAAMAVASGREVGIDLEPRGETSEGQVDAMVDRWFSDRERGELRAMDAGARAEAFVRTWTRKEAYLKATGLGLSRPLGDFDVPVSPWDLAATRLQGRDDPAVSWLLMDLAVWPGFASSLVVESSACDVLTFQAELDRQDPVVSRPGNRDEGEGGSSLPDPNRDGYNRTRRS